MRRSSETQAERLQRRDRWLSYSALSLFLLVLWEPVLFQGKSAVSVLPVTLVCLYAVTKKRRLESLHPPQHLTGQRRLRDAAATALALVALGGMVLRCLNDPAPPDAYKVAVVVAVNVAGLAFAAWLREAVPAWFAREATVTESANTSAAPNAANNMTVPPATVSVRAQSINTAAGPQVVTIGRRTP